MAHLFFLHRRLRFKQQTKECVMQITRRGWAIGAVACYGATTNFAQAEGLEDTSVSRTVEQLRLAMIGADKKALEALLAPELSFGHSNGLVQTKAEFMGAVLGRKEVFKTITLTDHSASPVGSTAIVRQIFASDLELEGKPLSVKLGELQIWQKHKTSWRLIARQAFKA
jgi:hypothetical protein